MPTEAKNMGKMFEIVNLEISPLMLLLFTSLSTDPNTLYKYYTYGYETYMVFLNLVDTCIILAIFIGGAFVLSKYLLKKATPG